MLKGKFVRNYRKARTNEQKAAGQPGTVVFVYEVSGSKELLEQYELIQDKNFVADDKTGTPLFFSTRYTGEVIDILITPNDRIVVDTSEFEKLASLANQASGPLAAALASRAADLIMGNVSRTAPVVVKEKEEEPLDKS